MQHVFRLLLGSAFASMASITAFVPCGPALAPAMATTVKPVYAVTAIRGHLYYDDNGEIDPQDLVKLPAGSLHNTVIGEGIAKRPSNTTLLLIEVSGPSFASKDIGSLSVKAVTDRYNAKGVLVKETVLERSVNLNHYFQEHQRKILVPFWLYHTGSMPVSITATLKGGKDALGLSSSLSKTILFGGGE
ncbi:MAG: hypothetical protein CVV27_11930 [Candidatus Melainabacteria bacterium HGW-Melainabacteria-1]|nr:MAG: hypothetical protein CVV27_11930 [Candidatus Melainabacteria bacterium HGW-Melainabacteria-1]